MANPSESVQNAAQSAKQSAAESLNRQKEGAASSLGNLAGALRKAAHESDGGGGDASTTRMAEWAADGLERLSTTLRSNDLDGVVRQVQSFARSQPVAFFFAAAAAGFLATRFLKAGSEPQREKTDVSSTVPF